MAQSPGCKPLLEMYTAAVAAAPRRWVDIEAAFLNAMWEFEQNLTTASEAKKSEGQADNQNGKGDFVNDLTALILENCSSKSLLGRGSVPGLMFPTHKLDASYPPSGPIEVLLETKAVGAPKTVRNPTQKNVLGRPGSADLDKRVKEAMLKTIDLKAEWARSAGQGGGPTADLITWLRRSKPLCFLVLVARVIDNNDLERCIKFGDAANQVMDAVGLFAYEPGSSAHRAMKVPPHLELDRALARMCTALRALP
jgi:hypothetical protein